MEHRLDQLLKDREVAVVSHQTTCELPDSLLVIEVGAIRGKEIQPKHGPMGFQPRSQEIRVVVLGVIQHDDEASPSPAVPQQRFQEVQKGDSVERIPPLGE